MGTSSIVQQPENQPVPTPGAGGDLRAHIHGMWASVSSSWATHAAFVDARHLAVAGRMLELTTPQAGERVLELACGPGGVGLAAAERVAPGGEVVLSDVAVEMTTIASTRAAALGLSNVSTRVIDLEGIDEPDGSFDVVVCRDGLQFAIDPGRAAREISRVLRPGGRVAVAVWGPRARNPWLGVVLDAVSAQLGRPVPPPGIPGPFSLEEAAGLADLLRDAGLREVAVGEMLVPLRAPSFDQWWAMTTALAGPLALMLSSLPDEVAHSVREMAREAIGPYQTAAGLEFPGVALLAAARR
jgi:SAM-dependent methyltransferase